MQNLYESNQKTIIHRFIFGILYGIVFISVSITHNPTIFIIWIIILMFGTLYESWQINVLHKSISITLTIYIVIAYMLLMYIKLKLNNEIAVIILLTHVWSSDLGGYVIGSLFGKHKLNKFSPKKTWEGVLGSFLFCMICSFCLKEHMEEIINYNTLLASCVLCTTAVLGDFFISIIKRINHQKDSGIFLPGHGGFLDRLDSLLLSIYPFWIYLKYSG